MQVCVPESWTDDEARTFAEREFPCGTTNGWVMRQDGDPLLRGSKARVGCADRAGHVHIMFDA